jgi:hypothetical protein
MQNNKSDVPSYFSADVSMMRFKGALGRVVSVSKDRLDSLIAEDKLLENSLFDAQFSHQ